MPDGNTTFRTSAVHEAEGSFLPEASSGADAATPKSAATLQAQLPQTPRARMEFLRDFLKELPDERFDIRDYFTDDRGRVDTRSTWRAEHCGTAACLAGWAIHLFVERAKYGHPQVLGAATLGLSVDEADDMFTPGAMQTGLCTRSAAVRVLDIYLAEQVVDWERAIAETAVR